MNSQIFINLPVSDLPRSLAFFKAPGFSHIPFSGTEEDGKCILTGEPSQRRVVWAKSY